MKATPGPVCVQTQRISTQASVSEQGESPSTLLLSFSQSNQLPPFFLPHDCLQVTVLVLCQSHLIASCVKWRLESRGKSAPPAPFAPSSHQGTHSTWEPRRAPLGNYTQKETSATNLEAWKSSLPSGYFVNSKGQPFISHEISGELRKRRASSGSSFN